MRIKIDGHETMPPDMNRVMRTHARNYSYINLGRLSKVHQTKILQWQFGLRSLMVDELRRVANVLDIKFEVYE